MLPLAVVHRERAAVALLLCATLGASACSSDSPSEPTTSRVSDGVILFTAFDVQTGQGSTVSIASDGSARTALSGPSVDEMSPIASPDGQQIVVVRMLDTLPQVYVMRADGSNARLAATVPGGGYWPSWTSDGASIVFSNYGELKTWMMRADGSNAHRVVDGQDDEQLPALSPDGKHIVFTSARQFSETFRVFELFLMDVDGSNVQRLTTSPEMTFGYNVYPRWSPDGSRIAFIRSINNGVSHVFIMNADGSGMRQLTTGNLNDLGVAWSPDGKQLVLSRESIGGFGELYVTDADDGKRLVNITNTVGVDEQYPSWGVRANR